MIERFSTWVLIIASLIEHFFIRTSASSTEIVSIPSQVVAFPWGSASISKTFFPFSASCTAVDTEILVLPVPPFCKANVIVFIVSPL